jgi:serine/threonine protein kinase
LRNANVEARTSTRAPDPSERAEPTHAEIVDHVPTDTEPSVTSTEADNLVGRAFGDHELIRKVARGGMGVVYKARHTKLARTVALKMILSGGLAGTEVVQRFQAEPEANLKHSGIVPIFVRLVMTETAGGRKAT